MWDPVTGALTDVSFTDERDIFCAGQTVLADGRVWVTGGHVHNGQAGTPEVTGKDAGLDRDKTTFVSFAGVEGARRLTDELIDASLGSLSPFGRRGERLADLAELVRSRDR